MWRLSSRAALRGGIRLTEKGRLLQAFRLLSRAAKAGLPEAEYRVGRCYLEGAGTPHSCWDGLRWLERAGSQGHVDAQSRLATLSSSTVSLRRRLALGHVPPPPCSRDPIPKASRISSKHWFGRGGLRKAVPQTGKPCLVTSSHPAPRRFATWRQAAHYWYKKAAEANCPQRVWLCPLARPISRNP